MFLPTEAIILENLKCQQIVLLRSMFFKIREKMKIAKTLEAPGIIRNNDPLWRRRQHRVGSASRFKINLNKH